MTDTTLVCQCGFGVWSTPWPGRPRRCLRCGRFRGEDLPCRHVHASKLSNGQYVCADCETPWRDGTGGGAR